MQSVFYGLSKIYFAPHVKHLRCHGHRNNESFPITAKYGHIFLHSTFARQILYLKMYQNAFIELE